MPNVLEGAYRRKAPEVPNEVWNLITNSVPAHSALVASKALNFELRTIQEKQGSLWNLIFRDFKWINMCAPRVVRLLDSFHTRRVTLKLVVVDRASTIDRILVSWMVRRLSRHCISGYYAASASIQGDKFLQNPLRIQQGFPLLVQDSHLNSTPCRHVEGLEEQGHYQCFLTFLVYIEVMSKSFII